MYRLFIKLPYIIRLKPPTTNECKHFLGIFLFVMTLILGVSCLITAIFLLNVRSVQLTEGLLYPHESETREVKVLDGLWNFLKSNQTTPSSEASGGDGWHLRELRYFGEPILMPVPASYNDITTDRALRDHVGAVWYEKKFFVPSSWSQNDQRTWLRFGSVHYFAIVYLNGDEVVQHKIGHLPFEVEISKFVKFGKENRLTVMCDNIIDRDSIPQGAIYNSDYDDENKFSQSYTFDFFNYAGIHRSVHLFTTPKIFIQDVEVKTNLIQDNKAGVLDYEVKIDARNVYNANNKLVLNVQLRNKKDEVVALNSPKIGYFYGSIVVSNVHPWWPYLMHPEPGYLYEMEVFLHDESKNVLLDVYRLKIGFRSLNWNNDGMTINGKPLYLRGFGKHEDSDIRGKGLDLSVMARDFNLLKWIGANSYRTTHYPYSEESMQMADEQGIMLIDECPSVDTSDFNSKLLENHKSSIEQLIHRDRNHPSVIMWSIANEPTTNTLKASTYFGHLAEFTRKLDATRPVTIAIATPSHLENVGKHLDIICFNRYNGWYSNPGRLHKITQQVINEALEWRRKLNKPVIISEYGADTLEGLHILPSYIWSEEYQVDLFSKHFKAFDILRESENWFMGEMVWNFADFKTDQSYTRVGGNKKGVFTRNRQPKAAAHLLRKRYFALGQEIDKCQLVPNDLYVYVTNNSLLMTNTLSKTHLYSDESNETNDDNKNLQKVYL